MIRHFRVIDPQASRRKVASLGRVIFGCCMFGKSSASWAASLSLVAVLAQAPVHAQPVDDDCARLAPDARIAPLARFSNMRYTEEHAYGYDVLLWQAGDCLVGMLQHSEGLIGDTPMGLLESVEFDPSTGAIAFAAKLTMGLKAAVEDGEAVYRPSRDYFTFTG